MQVFSALWCRAHLASDGLIDGDTLRATLLQDAAAGAALARVQRDPAGQVRLRLLGLDAPETSYALAPSGLAHQPVQAALAATEALHQALALPAGGAVVWLYLHGIDRYGRLLTLLFRTSARQPPAALHGPSLNSQLLAAGAAYPDLSASLPPRLLDTLSRASRQARDQQRGLWPADRTRTGFPLTALHTLTETHLVWPRLFRRVMECASQQGTLADGGAPALAPATLREFLLQRDGLWLERGSGLQKNLGEWLEMAGQHCCFPGDVENLLHQPPPGSANLTYCGG